MSIVVTESRVVDPEVNNCVCGSSHIKHSAENVYSSDGGGYAYVKCESCGLKMEEKSSIIGYGESLEDIYIRVVNRWNSVMRRSNGS
jgi:hypothetical protein